MLEIAGIVNPGAVLSTNDDRALINKTLIENGIYEERSEQCCIALVCDGVGGEAFGFEAAEIAANVFLEEVFEDCDELKVCLQKANQRIQIAQRKDFSHVKMTTTIAGIYLKQNDFIAFNIGDSRVYRFRKPYIAQLSKDHSLEQEYMELGLEVKNAPKHIITHYLGGNSSAPFIVDGKERVFEGDIFIVCTDGIWSVMENEDFERILLQDITVKEMCVSIMEKALIHGSQDNLSVIVIRRK